MTQRQLAASSTALDADHATGASGAESLELEGIVLDDTAELQVSASRNAFQDLKTPTAHPPDINSTYARSKLARGMAELPALPESTEAYLYLRAQDPNRSFTFDLPPSHWLPILLSAQQHSYHREHHQMVLRDLIDCASRRPEKYEEVIFSILERSTSVTPARKAGVEEDAHPSTIELDDQETLNLFHSLPPSSVFPGKHTTASVTRIFEAMLHDNDLTFSIHVPFLQAAYPLLITPPSDQAPPRGLHQRALWALFHFMLRSASKPNVGRNDSERDVLLGVHIFSALASANCLPRAVTTIAFQGLAAIARAPSFPSVDVGALWSTILQALVLSCWRWGWRGRALVLLTPSLGVNLNTARRQNSRWWNARRGSTAAARSPQSQPQLAAPPSPSTCNLIHQVALTLLASPCLDADFHSALALVRTYAYVRKRLHPDAMPPVPRAILQRLHDGSRELFGDPKTTARIYSRLRELSVCAEDDVPPDRVFAARLLELHVEDGDRAAALRLIHSILARDRAAQSDPTTIVLDMEPAFVAAVARAGYVDLAHELWRRADRHWKGYPRAHVCGSRQLVEVIVEGLERPRDHEHEEPVSLEFAERVLKTFEGIQLRGRSPDPKDVETFTRCSEILGGTRIGVNGVSSKGLPERMKA